MDSANRIRANQYAKRPCGCYGIAIDDLIDAQDALRHTRRAGANRGNNLIILSKNFNLGGA